MPDDEQRDQVQIDLRNIAALWVCMAALGALTQIDKALFNEAIAAQL